MMRFHRVRWVLCFGVMLVPLITNIAASQKTAPSSRVEVELSYAPLVKDVAPAPGRSVTVGLELEF